MGNLNTVRFETALVYLSTNHRGSGDFCSALAYYRRTLAPSPGPMVLSAGDIEAGSVHLRQQQKQWRQRGNQSAFCEITL